jgi:hypothetical protein
MVGFRRWGLSVLALAGVVPLVQAADETGSLSMIGLTFRGSL